MSPWDGSIVTKVVRYDNTTDEVFTRTNDQSVFVPHNLYRVGDTLRFCK